MYTFRRLQHEYIYIHISLYSFIHSLHYSQLLCGIECHLSLSVAGTVSLAGHGHLVSSRPVGGMVV